MNFRGENNKNAIQNETDSFALGFGEKSKFDETTLQIFREFSAKSTNQLYNKKIPQSYFYQIKGYNLILDDLDKDFVWRKVIDSN